MSGAVLVLLVALAGGAGSALRYTTDHLLPVRWRERYPAGTLTVNLLGSFALGLVAGAVPGTPVGTVLGTGLLGGYTTFSTASLDAVRLLERRRWGAALAHGPGQMLLCVLAAGLGLLLSVR